MYQALYRKYRSKTFEELVGQDSITKSLKNQISKLEISHAYIFSGTRGTGKTSAAKIFAKAVNCLNPKNGDPCNECENCRAIAEDRAIDVIEMDAASNNGVDDIRELKEKVVYPPQSLKYKVYIIDEVHMLSKGAFNALLKILEEPPSHLIFILATTELEKIPSTILSRAQKFNFKRIDKRIIIENLKRITELEGKECTDEVYKLIANNSDGAMRDALSILDQLFSLEKNVIDYDSAIEVLGISSDKIILELVKALLDKDLKKAMENLNAVYKEGKDISILITDLVSRFRDLMVLKMVKEPGEMVLINNFNEYKELSENIDIDEIIFIIKTLNECLVNVKYAQDKRVVLEMSIIKITDAYENNLKERIENIENYIYGKDFNREDIPKTLQKVKKPSSNTVKETANTEELKGESAENTSVDKIAAEETPAQEEETKQYYKADKDDIMDDELNSNKIKSDWNNILIEFKKKGRVNIPILLSSGRVEDYNNQTLVIEFEKSDSFKYKAISDEDNIAFIEDFLNNYYNKEIKVRFTLNEDREKETAIEKLEELFGKDNINRI
ncbi:DNA polymerase III, gamma and tau subunits [Peptoniphilus sp. ING2-D1G]|nr:DNA polymerase III, gamma and tau subunits [Peptoniphilus sp. ING2-D1G]